MATKLDRQTATALTDDQLAAEIKRYSRMWSDLRDDPDFEGGRMIPPGEWLIDRLTELEAEQERRMAL